MKIITGEFKGRNIEVPPDVRPVSMRVKESCFSMLGSEVQAKNILDLFAGSGSLGLEAISRGAAQAVFIDSNFRSLNIVRDNISSLGLDQRAKSYLKKESDAIKAFERAGASFDIVFLDPPYYEGLLIKALQQLEEYDILTPSGYLVGFCSIKDDFLENSKVFSLIVHKKYGKTRLLIYRKT